ncbi:MAG TPA: alternative ribosome rescue aminoacyl-tRNA hydrolase ArfB [Acidimicrobiia bacterium]|nr:alternative ribosome rescue aminoacyl-tRNA hydrolase ArfB [Acidimicrobiia bacterium]
MSLDDPLAVGPITIPPAELEWRFDTSGGPGGQHANRSATRVELSWDLAKSPSIDDGVRSRLLKRLGHRAADGVVRVASAESRSQWRNRAIARSRLAGLLADALAPPPAPRKSTKPSRAAKRRRLEAKRRRGETKRLRRSPRSE